MISKILNLFKIESEIDILYYAIGIIIGFQLAHHITGI